MAIPSMGYMATPSVGLPYVWSADALAQYDERQHTGAIYSRNLGTC